VTDPIPNIMAESADNVAYGAAMQAVVAAARAWRETLKAGVAWERHSDAEIRLIDATLALDALEARLRKRAPP
jgi:hypothetical protein